MLSFEELLGRRKKNPIDRNYSLPVNCELQVLIEDAKAKLGTRIVNEAIRMMIRDGLPRLLKASEDKAE